MNRFLMPRAALAVPAFALAIIAVACGGSTSSTPSATPDAGTGVLNPEAGPAQPADAGADTGPSDPLDPNYPTTHTPIPQVDYNGGHIIQNVKVVTVTFANDALVTTLEQFGDTITQTPWWDTVRNGYCDNAGNCVGQGTSGGHVHLTDTGAGSYTDSSQGGASSIQTMIQGYVTDGTFPPPDSNTLYAIYFPTTASIDLDGSGSCSTFGGYHNSVVLTPAPTDDGGAAGTPIETAYAILPRCDNSQAELTLAASHEFIEAATDPYLSAIAYYMQNQLWAGELGGEVGDLCVTYNNDDAYSQAPFTVQRIWSNIAAAASHDPCVPAPAPSTQAYFNVAPAVGKDQLSMKVNATKTIDLTAFSDAPMAADWDISADELDEFQGGPNVLTLALSQSTAHNGSKITLTVTLNSSPQGGYAIYQITSKSGNIEHSWPMAIVAE